MLHLLQVLSLAGVAAASYAGNLNYRSPSLNHPSLGISIHKVNKRNDPSAACNASQLKFTHGVASGDPYPNSVILWTRCAPMLDDVDDNSTVSGYVPLYNPVHIYNDTDEHKPISKAPICISFKIATDKALTKVADSGTVYTSSDVDYTLKVRQDSKALVLSGEGPLGLWSPKLTCPKVEAQKLKPYTQYYYQFSVCKSNNTSPLGRTKTTPAANDLITKIRLAVYSCSNFRTLPSPVFSPQLSADMASVWLLQCVWEHSPQRLGGLCHPSG